MGATQLKPCVHLRIEHSLIDSTIGALRSGLAPIEAYILGAARRCRCLASDVIVAQERHWLLAPAAVPAKIAA